jgi:hypothetical protein
MTTPLHPSTAAESGSPFSPRSDADDARQAGRLLWRNRSILILISGALTFLGFAVVTPSSKIANVATDLVTEHSARVKKDDDQDSAVARIERRQEQTEQALRSNNAAWCVTLTPREAKLAQLDCGGVERPR